MVELTGASTLARFWARGSESAGLGRGEIRSTSATGSGFTIVLDLKEEREKEHRCFFRPAMLKSLNH